MTDSGAPSAVQFALLRAVQVFRAAACAWLVVVTVLSVASIDRPVGAAVGVAAAVAVTVAWQRVPAGDPVGRGRHLIGVELLVGAGLLAADGWVFDAGRAQSFGSVWPVSAVLAVAVLVDGRTAAGAGVVLGVGRAVGEVTLVAGPWSATRVLAIASTGVLFALAGWAAGWAADRIRAAEDAAARAEARAEVAAELHDGVLQTLAVVQRRSDDAQLVDLARRQEADLRRLLTDDGDAPTVRAPMAVAALARRVAADATARFGLRVDVATVPPLPAVTREVSDALGRALGECLANVAKHAGTDRAVLFGELVADQAGAARLEVGVTDRGVGFAVEQEAWRGLEGSVRRRMDAVGGTLDVRSAPGAGTTVTLAVPVAGDAPTDTSGRQLR